jgi:hypothetical protein
VLAGHDWQTWQRGRFQLPGCVKDAVRLVKPSSAF